MKSAIFNFAFVIHAQKSSSGQMILEGQIRSTVVTLHLSTQGKVSLEVYCFSVLGLAKSKVASHEL